MSVIKQQLTNKQELGQRLTPAQIQVVKLLEMPTLQLEEEILNKVEENPALEIASEEDPCTAQDSVPEEDEQSDDETDAESEEYTMEDYYGNDEYSSPDVSDYELVKINQSKDDPQYEHVIVDEESFQSDLVRQLSFLELDEKQFKIAEYLIGCLEDDGYLKLSNDTLVNNLKTDPALHLECTGTEIETVIKNVLQALEPAGIGARNLRECLLLQLAGLPETPLKQLTQKIISHNFEELEKHHYDKIIKKHNCTEEELNDVLQFIKKKLNPRPGNMQSGKSGTAQSITPDFIITEEDGKLQLALNRSYVPKIRLNPIYAYQYAHNQEKKKTTKLSQRQKGEEKIIKKQVEEAMEFLDFLTQRDETLYKTMKAIMEWQKEYFLTSDKAKLRPMILENIAATTGLDKSTISRVSNSKYVQTDFGIIPLKTLFAEAVGDDSTSSRELKENIAVLIKNENKCRPLKDEELVKMMSEKGYKIARRTIAKYREELGIPVARLRKELGSK